MAKKPGSNRPAQQHVHLARTIALHLTRFYLQVLVTQADTHKICQFRHTAKGKIQVHHISITQLHTYACSCRIRFCTSLHRWALEGYVFRCNSTVLCLSLFILIPIVGETVTSSTPL